MKQFSYIFLILIFFLVSKGNSQVASLEATFLTPKVDGITVPYQNGIPVPSFEKQERETIDLKGTWKKQRFVASDIITLAKRDETGYNNLVNEAQNRHLPSYDDAAWQTKQIPGVENNMNPFPTVPEYYEDGVWYRYKFDVADLLNSKFIKLMFYSVNYVADVWLNGNYLGYHEGGYTPFAFDVSNKLNYGTENVIAVRVDNPAWGSRNDIVPYTRVDWFNYTGIIHDVYLEVSNKVSVIRADVVPLTINGEIQTTVTLYNKSGNSKNVDVQIEIFNADINEGNIQSDKASSLIGNVAAFSGTSQSTLNVLNDSVNVWRTNLTVDNPRLWSPKFPNLYIMKVTVKESGNVIDEYYTQFGIRTIETVEDKVYLNNTPVFFTGVARHEDHPVYGRSIPINVIYDDLIKVKDVNANMLRTAHYPNHLYTYQIADRLGIAIVEEIPVWWFDDQMPWVIQNSIRHIHEQMFKEMVFKDYNRPSVLLWSATNECLDVTNRKTFITKVKQDINFNYPDGRLITQSAAADRPGPNDPSQAACDVAGWTMYFGIFHGGTYYDGTRRFLTDANYEYPFKPVLDTEFGYWSGELNAPGGQSAQVTVFKETFSAFTFRAATIKPNGAFYEGGYLMGITWWCIFDWYSHQHPQGFQSMGLYRMGRDTAKTVSDTLKTYYAPYFNLGGMPTSVENESEHLIPDEYLVKQNYPNPFNPETTIEYQIPSTGMVELKVYNVLGEEVTTVVNEFKNAGTYKVNFNGSELSSGVYFYELRADNFKEIKKLIILK
ncbi:MAG: glycoside hydrolase family 2 TIM barrel-domain containing protein [Ignavibacteria bacterium]|nr:glycoside hydrolase family 2 TIM barrel-domain containing protein [Ignavibacteria bacterium]